MGVGNACERQEGRPPQVTPEPDYRWTRLELALFPDDATVFYEGFAGKTDVAPPTATAARPTAVATPPYAAGLAHHEVRRTSHGSGGSGTDVPWKSSPLGVVVPERGG